MMIQENNLAEGVWDEDGFCEVVEREVPVEDEPKEDEDALLRKAARSNGRP